MCDCKNNIIRINGIISATPGTTGSLILSTIGNVAPKIGNRYVTRICVSLKNSSLTGEEALILRVNGVDYNVRLFNGEPLQVGRLRRRELLKMTFVFDASASGGHFRVCDGVCPLCLRVTTSTTPPTPNEDENVSRNINEMTISTINT